MKKLKLSHEKKKEIHEITKKQVQVYVRVRDKNKSNLSSYFKNHRSCLQNAGLYYYYYLFTSHSQYE